MIVQKYRTFQKGKSVFWEVMVSVIVKRTLYVHGYNSGWLPRWSCLHLQIQKIVNGNKQRKITYCEFNVTFN